MKAQISQLKATKSDATSTPDLKSLDSQNLHLKETVINLQQRIENFKAENKKVKRHYQELFNSIKITCVQTNEKTISLQTKIENLKTQLKGKTQGVTSNVKPPKVSAFEKYAIDVELIPPRQRNNRVVHHGYLNCLKDTLDTLREIVEEARSELPSDSNLDYACVYTKQSQELLANASASCPKVVNKQDKYIATTPVTKKKHVTFVDPLETLGNNKLTHVKPQSVLKTNVPIHPPTGVNTATIASGSNPRSNTKKDRTLPAKSVMKQVEAHSRMNKSNEKQKNCVDSSISYKRTVINLNSNTSCKTCNKCLISVNHDQCVVHSAVFVKHSTATKVWRVKQVKKVWQATGKLSTTIGHQWRPTGRLHTLGVQCPLTRNTPPKILATKQWKPTGRRLPLERQCSLARSTDLKSDCMPAEPQDTIPPVAYNLACSNQKDPNCNWGSDVSNSPLSFLFKCRSYRSSFGIWTQVAQNI
ncbi:hypothetical protein Tco_1189596 [Tanacetum coccineum]